MSDGTAPEHRAVLQRLPAALRALVEAELAAGNAILEAGAGHPAPPAGDMIKLAHDLRTRAIDADDGLRAYARDTSTHHTEVTDRDGFYWVLTAPHPPPPVPDMDAIRQARAAVETPIARPKYAPGTIEMDVRGEMLIYHEADRRADIVWTWYHGNRLHRSTLTHWWYPAVARNVALSDEEKAWLLQRFIDFAGRNTGPAEVVD